MLLGGSFIVPFVMSFEKKIHFISKWKAFLPAILIIGSVFVLWDVEFTRSGVWQFNPDFVSGLNFINLPIEEVLFFFVIPYISLFIYEIAKLYFKLPYNRYVRLFNLLLAMALLALCFVNTHADYTFTTFVAMSLVLFWNYVKKIEHTSYMFVTYAIILVPFAIVNGVLTSMPVVIYNNLENLSIRVGTIPIEDFFYAMLLIFSNILLYDYFSKKFNLS